MTTTTRKLTLLRLALPCTALLLLSACGGGGGGAAPVVTYTVSATAGSGGSISPPSATVNSGSTTTLTVTPSSGYGIASVTGCGGTLSGSTYTTGAITANCAVTASFVVQFAVTGTAGNGGTLSPASVNVNSGSTTTLTVTPNSGYIVGTVTGCGGTLSGGTYTTGAISANCTVTASFIAQYVVTGTAATGGSLSPASATVNAGSTTTLTATPNNGYILTGVTGCGGTLTGPLFTTAPVSANCTVNATFSAVASFTWASGPSNSILNGVYGTQGVPSSTTVPGARNGSVAWTDSSGNFWLFGGSGIDFGSGSGPAPLNDLWKYSPSTGEWTWVGGSNTVGAVGVYGAKGTPTATNMPGARDGAVTWTDSSGNVWLFGGSGYDSTGTNLGVLNDLWIYSLSSGEWTWVGGSSTALAPGVYGTQGTPASTNMPGARYDAVSWKDASGDLWLFGGIGADSTGIQGFLNDLWEYSPTSGEWTWVSGSNMANASGNYGTQGLVAATNMPGARSDAVGWVDANGNFWLFGGLEEATAGVIPDLGDLWMFSPSSGEWTWEGGSNVAGGTGVYGTQGVAAATNAPGSRQDATGWTDTAGNLWLFGGSEASATNTVGYLNDLWEYSTSTHQWIWVKGSDTPNAISVHGTIGIAAITNIPGGREQMASAMDANGNVWLFGGLGYGFVDGLGELNDLWLYPNQ